MSLRAVLTFVLGLTCPLVAQESEYFVYVAAESADEIYCVRFDGSKATVHQ